MIKGFATIEGTSKYFKKFSHNPSMIRHTPWFSAPAIALGTHMGEMRGEAGEEDSLLYRKAVEFLLKNGVNFIDTALNYRGMKSERDVGIALNSLLNEEKTIDRSEFIVSTKAGLLPGDIDAGLPPPKYREEVLLKEGIIEEKDLHPSGNFFHILTPRYYEFAIEKSKKHLGLETIDIYYIHNPECSMDFCGKEKFYRKLFHLFEFLEKQVDKDNIRFYGMATWRAFQVDRKETSYISLKNVLDVAKEVAGNNHHFKFVQIPCNKSYPDGAVKKTQDIEGRALSAIEAACELGLFTTISIPLDMGKIPGEGLPASEILRQATETKGVFSVMVGMKKQSHMEENIKILFL